MNSAEEGLAINKPELLSSAGNLEKLKTVINFGADANRGQCAQPCRYKCKGFYLMCTLYYSKDFSITSSIIGIYLIICDSVTLLMVTLK